MNKELLPLKALEIIKNSIKNAYYSEHYREEELNVIENALKDYERIKKEDDEQGFHYHCDEFCECLEIKALEIIKEKRVDVKDLIDEFEWSDGLESYNKRTNHQPLTQEEYDLLKEVLL